MAELGANIVAVIMVSGVILIIAATLSAHNGGPDPLDLKNDVVTVSSDGSMPDDCVPDPVRGGC